MNEQKYLEILERTGLERIYHYDQKKQLNYLCRAVIDLDNSRGQADAVAERIAEYIDAILYEAREKDAEEITDRFVFIADGKRFTFDPETGNDEWPALRDHMLKACDLRVEHSFVENSDAAEYLLEKSIVKQLADLIEGGCMADCVTIYVQSEMNDGGYEEDQGLEEHHLRFLWMNGRQNGEYICGEVPFIQDEHRVRSCTGWRQSDPVTGEETGMTISLHPKTSPVLLQRLRRSAAEFARRVNCHMEIMLNAEDVIRYLRGESEYLPSAADKAYDDAWQLKAPDLRAYFTESEVNDILNRYPTISKLYIRHADPACTEDQLEKVRFAWSLALILQYEGQARSSWNPEVCRKDLCDKIRSLPREIAEELEEYAFRHSGLGDLSVLEDNANRVLLMDGACVRMRIAYLNGIEDVRRLCDFLNELNEIERLTQEECGVIPPIDGDVSDGSLSVFNSTSIYDENMAFSGTELEKVPGMPCRTLREHSEYAFSNNRFGCTLNLLNLNGMMFESDDFTNWARLRFRKVDGKYIYEIAQAEI